jgi:uncharacterized membrane protein
VDGLISLGIAVVFVAVIGVTIAFYFGGVWERFTSDTERRIEEQRPREERQGERQS